MKSPRPKRRKSIPLAVQILVALRQLNRSVDDPTRDRQITAKVWLSILKVSLAHQLAGGPCALELHHRPALVNREWNPRTKDTIPPANDPDYLVWLTAEDHDIETRVRGIGAAFSDLAERRRAKRRAKRKAKAKSNRRRSKSQWPKVKTKWPKRPMRWRTKPCVETTR